MKGNDNGEGGDDEGVDKKGDDSGAFGKVGFDVNVNVFGDSLIPSEGGDETKSRRSKSEGLNGNFLGKFVEFFLSSFHENSLT